ncbi:MAG: hypothetical protein ABIG60_04625 [Patescibacteria group bacterium]
MVEKVEQEVIVQCEKCGEDLFEIHFIGVNERMEKKYHCPKCFCDTCILYNDE